MGFDIDEAIDDQNWKKESSVNLRFTSENDLDEIFNEFTAQKSHDNVRRWMRWIYIEAHISMDKKSYLYQKGQPYKTNQRRWIPWDR